jgi:glycosyltransferase involved in cell wall biosynthesis
MSVGCVPVISAFNEGIRKVVTEDIGFVLPVEQLSLFAGAIEHLHNNRNELAQRKERAYKKVKEDFNAIVQSRKYFDLFSNYSKLKKPVRRRIPNYGGMLDHPMVPRFLAGSIRALRG